MKKHSQRKGGKVSPRQQAVNSLLGTPHVTLIPTETLKLAKRINEAKNHNRKKEAINLGKIKQQKTENFSQRQLEKQKTRQKLTRRQMVA